MLVNYHALISSKTFQSSFMLSCCSKFIGFKIFILNPSVGIYGIFQLSCFFISYSQLVEIHGREEFVFLMVSCLTIGLDGLIEIFQIHIGVTQQSVGFGL